MAEKAGYTQQELVNSLSILGEMKRMSELYSLEAQLRLEEPATEETKRLLTKLAEYSARMSKVISNVLKETVGKFDELILVKELLKE